MSIRVPRSSAVVASALLLIASTAAFVSGPPDARAQTVEDGSDAAIGPKETRKVLDLIERHLSRPDAKITSLRRSGDSSVCGSVNVKNRDGLYIGERGFVVDLSNGYFGRVPEGPEMLSSMRAKGYEDMERARHLYFTMCLD